MTKYNKQNRLDEKAVSIISDYFMNKHGDQFDLQFHGIKDNTPDTDGFLRLRKAAASMHGDYLNNVVFFQLKGTEQKIIDGTYTSSRKFIDFCKEINLPTILFVVANINEVTKKQSTPEIYWYHFSNINIEILNKTNKQDSRNVRIPNLELLKRGDSDLVEQFYVHIKNLAKKNEFLDLPKEILNIAIDLKDKILLVASIIYLVGRVTKVEYRAIARMLKVTGGQMSDILLSLHKQELIYKNKDIYIFKSAQDEIKRDVGQLLVYEAINKIDLDKLFSLFIDHKQKLQIYKNLSDIRHPVVFDFINRQADKLISYAKK